MSERGRGQRYLGKEGVGSCIPRTAALGLGKREQQCLKDGGTWLGNVARGVNVGVLLLRFGGGIGQGSMKCEGNDILGGG